MRFKVKPTPKLGDTRIVEKFLWFPKKIENNILWLENARFLQKYDFYYKDVYTNALRSELPFWQDVKWL